MADRVKTKITDADLLALGDVKAEVRDGELIIYPMSPNKMEHGAYGSKMVTFVSAFVVPRKLGRVFTEMTAFNLEVDSEGGIKGSVAPDVAFVSFERLALDAPMDVIARDAPDLVVEITSDSDVYDDVLDKVAYYLDHGVPQVWVLASKLHEVHAFSESNRAGKRLTLADDLIGEGVLDGFSIPVRAIFDDQDSILQTEVLRRLMAT
jgi:Uma2 family endonuclease